MKHLTISTKAYDLIKEARTKLEHKQEHIATLSQTIEYLTQKYIGDSDD